MSLHYEMGIVDYYPSLKLLNGIFDEARVGASREDGVEDVEVDGEVRS